MKLNQKDADALRKAVEEAVRPLISNLFNKTFHIKFESVAIIHEPLIPEGDKFKFNVVLTAFPKMETKNE